MTDEQIIDRLLADTGSVKALAATLNVSRQSIWVWRGEGLSLKARLLICQYAAKAKFRLPKGFLERAIA